MEKINNAIANIGNNAKVDLNKYKDINASGVEAAVGTTTGTTTETTTGTEGTAAEPTSTPKPEEKAGTVFNSSTNSYDIIGGKKQEYKPNSEGLSNTGQGAEAAVGTDFSWNKKATSTAQKTYSADILAQKQEKLNNRQTIENNAVNYQAQADMMKYQNNQNAEKVGWTGGYVLDQNRQMDYLKQSIQAQMYGAMELQRYGYDSALAAARLSFDLNQEEYARQYYEQAVSAALSEAQLTGIYFSAETKDMMAQRAVAEQKVNDPNLSEDERQQAQRLMDTIDGWFSTNGISKEGVKTLEAWEREQAQELEWSKEMWTRYQAAMESAKTDISENASEFIMLDANGKEIWDGTNITTGNWDALGAKGIGDYLLTGPDGSVNQAAVTQFYSYLDSTVTGELQSKFTEYCIKKGYVERDSDGNLKVKQTITDNMFKYFLESSGIVESLKRKYSEGISDDPKYSPLYDIFYNWDFTIEYPDGTMKELTYNQILGDGEKEPLNPPQGPTGGSGSGGSQVVMDGYRPKDKEQYDALVSQWTAGYTTLTDADGKEKSELDLSSITPRKSTVSAEGIKDELKYNYILETGSIDQSKVQDDDFDLDIGDKNYDLDVDWGYDKSGGACSAHNTFYDEYPNQKWLWDDSQAYLRAAYPEAKDGDLGMSYVNRDGTTHQILWIYYKGKWGYIQHNTGGDKLYNDVWTYLQGGVPQRWIP